MGIGLEAVIILLLILLNGLFSLSELALVSVRRARLAVMERKGIAGAAEARARPALSSAELLAAQALIRRIPVGEQVLDAILKLVRGARPETGALPAVKQHLAWGPGPRAAQALMLATRARAVLDGRLAPSIEDVIALAEPVLRHRMALNFAARADGVQLSDVIGALKASLG